MDSSRKKKRPKKKKKIAAAATTSLATSLIRLIAVVEFASSAQLSLGTSSEPLQRWWKSSFEAWANNLPRRIFPSCGGSLKCPDPSSNFLLTWSQLAYSGEPLLVTKGIICSLPKTKLYVAFSFSPHNEASLYGSMSMPCFFLPFRETSGSSKVFYCNSNKYKKNNYAECAIDFIEQMCLKVKLKTKLFA